ncbi:MAG: shikimate dehydrogenase [Candidatus Omnitrophota bacterium]
MADVKENRKTYGLLGRNISYSLSPVMHNAAFRHFGIPAEYKLFDIEERGLDEFFHDTVLGGKVCGINVTVPYKVKIKEMIEKLPGCSVKGSAKVLGAVNTVKAEGEGLVGYNTDGRGFYEALLDDTGFDPRGKKVFVLGAGGAARAICLFMASLSGKAPWEISAYDIDKKKLSSLKTAFDENFPFGKFVPAGPNDLTDKIAGCDLFVNATPIGAKEGDRMPVSLADLRDGTVVYDLVYCRETELVRFARAKGFVAANGLGMLVNQGAVAFNIWTEKPLEETKKIMRQALKEEGINI